MSTSIDGYMLTPAPLTANGDSEPVSGLRPGKYIFYTSGDHASATAALFLKGDGHSAYNPAATASSTVGGGDNVVDIATNDTAKITVTGATGSTSITASLNRTESGS